MSVCQRQRQFARARRAAKQHGMGYASFLHLKPQALLGRFLSYYILELKHIFFSKNFLYT